MEKKTEISKKKAELFNYIINDGQWNGLNEPESYIDVFNIDDVFIDLTINGIEHCDLMCLGVPELSENTDDMRCMFIEQIDRETGEDGRETYCEPTDEIIEFFYDLYCIHDGFLEGNK